MQENAVSEKKLNKTNDKQQFKMYVSLLLCMQIHNNSPFKRKRDMMVQCLSCTLKIFEFILVAG